LDIGVLGYIGKVQHKEPSPEVLSIPPGTPCIIKRDVYSKVLFMCKGKAVPLPAWSDPEGSRKLRFPDFMTTAQDGSEFVSLMHRSPLPRGNTPGTHFC